MKTFNIIVFLACLCIANALSGIVDKDVVINTDASTDLTTIEPAPEEEKILAKVEDEDYVRPLQQKSGDEIIISKDNVIPILKTIVLAFTHKKDPTYKEVLKSGGKALFKLTEKKVGGDKHIQTLLLILKKFVENYQAEEMGDEEEEVLGELAEVYLKRHKFRFLLPESLLLHHPEMKLFVAKKKELGELQGRQFKIDFAPYLSRLTELTSRVRTRLQELPLFNNLNLDRIGSTFSSIGSVFDEYIPALRNGAGIPDLGLSMGSLTALAAAGALISAPFFLSSFSASAREDEEDLYTNRRVSTGGFPAQQFIINQGNGQPGTIRRPQWMENYNNPQVQTYTPRVNPNYDEPASLPIQGTQGPSESNIYRDDEAYNKYLNDYNQWLQQYHNAIRLQQTPSSEYEEYYKKYKEWYAQYYKEQFGESPPQDQPAAPNSYQENNRIPNMQPPPEKQFQNNEVNQVNEREDEYSNYEDQSQFPPENREDVTIQQGPPQNIPIAPAVQKESSNFQVIHVDEGTKRPRPAAEPRKDLLPQPSALIGNPVPIPISYNYVNYQRTSPRPVYKPTASNEKSDFNPSTESGFRPLGSPPHTVLVFKKKSEEEAVPQEAYTPKSQNRDQESKLSGFSSVKSISIFKPPVQVMSPPSEKAREEPVWTTTTELLPAQPVEIDPIIDVEQGFTALPTTTKRKVTGVTSGIFKTTAKPTPRSATTPHPYYKKRYNQSVRVVTSTSVVTSRPFVKPSQLENNNTQTDFKKRKFTLTELLQNRNSQTNKDEPKQAEAVVEERKIERRIDTGEKNEVPDNEIDPEVSSTDNDLPVYALDPFYGPRLSRTDAIFHQLSLTDESCREQVVCNMYKNPNAYTPLSDFLSRQLTVTYEQLKRPAVNDERVLRFFKYLQAARAGQDGFDCLERYPKCSTDTTRLSYKPIVNAYKKVSILMNASGSP